MTKISRGRSGMTAKELMDELTSDPEFQRRDAESEEKRRERERELRVASRPIVEDLELAGVRVDSPWDLVSTSEPYPAALPVLFDHLVRGGYPDRVMEGIARALAVKPAAPYWPEFARLYRTAQGRDEREGLAVALAASATSAHVDDLIDLVSDTSLDSTRVHLVEPVAQLGGVRGRRALDDLRADPTIAREIRRILDRAERD